MARKHDFKINNKQSCIKLLGKNAAHESRLAKKNIVYNEGIENKVPEHKDSMKKNLSYRKSPPPPIKSLMVGT